MTWHYYTFPVPPSPCPTSWTTEPPALIYPAYGYPAPFRRAESPTQRAERLAREEQYRQEQARLQAAFLKAEARARQLLLSKLTAEQKASLEKDIEFTVTGSRGNRYRISCRSTVENVFSLDARGRTVRCYCGGPFGLPRSDFWLAQKLLIEADEDAFLAAAN